jgi:glutamate-ammonia-ligase adenylyltransferase
MALTRARPVFGPEAARNMLAEGIAAILRTQRDPVPTRADAARMRAEVARHKRPRGPLDVKLIDGGLVDLEFAVQALQLTRHEGLVPHFPAALAALIAAELIPPEMHGHYRLLHDMLVVMRLVAPDSAEPPEASRALVAKACGAADWDELLARYAAARQSVGDLWRSVAAG